MAGGGTDAKTKTSNKMGSFSMSSKPRVGVILRQAAGGQKPTHTPSEKVESLQNKYKDMCQNLKRLLKVLKERHAAMLETMQARDAVRSTQRMQEVDDVVMSTAHGRFVFIFLYFFVLT
jgi:hypothetical protein